MASAGPATPGSRTSRLARHVAFVSADGGALDEPSPASIGEPSTASSSTATRSSPASAASADLASIPAMPPSQLDEDYLMGSRAEREQWFPVAFAADLGEGTMIPFDLFNVPWVAFRDENGRAGCVKDECAHRACPISLGKLVDGKVQCPYHGWEYTTGGECVKMPSIKKLLPNVFVDAAPVVERDGLIRVWTGKWSDDAGAQRDALAKAGRARPRRAGRVRDHGGGHGGVAHGGGRGHGASHVWRGACRTSPEVDFTRIDPEISDDVFPKMIARALRSLRAAAPRETRFLPSRVLESRVALEGGPGTGTSTRCTRCSPRGRGGVACCSACPPTSCSCRAWRGPWAGACGARWRRWCCTSSWRRRARGGGDAGQAAERYRSWMREVSPD